MDRINYFKMTFIPHKLLYWKPHSLLQLLFEMEANATW